MSYTSTDPELCRSPMKLRRNVLIDVSNTLSLHLHSSNDFTVDHVPTESNDFSKLIMTKTQSMVSSPANDDFCWNQISIQLVQALGKSRAFWCWNLEQIVDCWYQAHGSVIFQLGCVPFVIQHCHFWISPGFWYFFHWRHLVNTWLQLIMSFSVEYYYWIVTECKTS